jgi:glycerol-3-phosphate acyltransferase PlsY
MKFKSTCGYILFSYLIGSIPFAYIWTRIYNGDDIREIAWGNVGTTNVMLNIGFLPGVLTMLGDVLKGIVVGTISRTSASTELTHLLPAVAIAGHNWPIWLKFHGGGGLATFIGSGLVIAHWWEIGTALIVWGILHIIVKDPDKSAVAACAVSPVAIYFLGSSYQSMIFFISSGIVISLRRIQCIVPSKSR